jgi:hypothetical protein
MLRPLGRLAIAFGLVLTLWILFYTLEPRKTAYSCRTVRSCLGFGAWHTYVHSVPRSGAPVESQTVLRDGTVQYLRETTNDDPEILFLVLSRDATSWSSDFRSTQRTAHDFMDLLASTKLNLTAASLGFLTSFSSELEGMKAASRRLPFSRVTLLQSQDAEAGVEYKDRHKPEIQLERRSALATVRNRLMLSALRDEKHIVWLDADVVELSNQLIQTMIHHSETKENASIITALCHQNQQDNYDKNAWKMNNLNILNAIQDEDREFALRELEVSRMMLPQIIKDTGDDDLLPVDSVGGTVLYMRAHIVKQGVVFPFLNMVGTTWNQAGWIGVETEGLCYLAKALKGGGVCYVLGGKHHARHADWG